MNQPTDTELLDTMAAALSEFLNADGKEDSLTAEAMWDALDQALHAYEKARGIEPLKAVPA